MSAVPAGSNQRPVRRYDADGRVIRLLPEQPTLPPGRSLTDIWPHLTDRKRLGWLRILERELELPIPVLPQPPAGPLPRQHLRALDRLDEIGARWVDALTWALTTGRWTAAAAYEDATDLVDQYIASRTRYDGLLADPEFWTELAAQCEDYVRDAPPAMADALQTLREGALMLLAARRLAQAQIARAEDQP